jgi:hypothetical protein
VLREADKLDETVKERKQREGGSVVVPPTPPRLHQYYRPMGTKHTVELPPPGFNSATFIMLGILLVIGIFTLFFMIPFFIMAYVAARGATSKTIVEVDSTKLRVERVGPLGRSVEEITVSELEELDVVGAGGVPKSNSASQAITFAGRGAIVARSDRTTVRFGESLEAPELEWLKAVIESAITSY